MASFDLSGACVPAAIMSPRVRSTRFIVSEHVLDIGDVDVIGVAAGGAVQLGVEQPRSDQAPIGGQALGKCS